MDQDKHSYSELLSQFASKASSELFAAVMIILGDLFFIYKTLPHVQYFENDLWYFYLILALAQIMVFALCLRLLFDNSVSRLKNQIDDLKRSLEQPRKPE